MEGAAALHLSASLTFWVTYFLSDDDWAAPDGRDFTWRNIFLKWCTTTSLVLILFLQYCFRHDWLLSRKLLSVLSRRRGEEISHLSLVFSWQTVCGMFSPQTWTRRTRQDKSVDDGQPDKEINRNETSSNPRINHSADTFISNILHTLRCLLALAAATYACSLIFYKPSRRYRIECKIIQRWY